MRDSGENLIMEESSEPFLPKSKLELNGLTQTKIMRLRYKWTIENFSYYGCSSSESLTSPLFFLSGDENTEWEVLMYPHSQKPQDSRIFMSLYLTLKTIPQHPLMTRFRFTLTNESGNNFSKTFRALYVSRISLGCPEFISREALFRVEDPFIPNDVLTVICQLNVLSKVSTNIESPFNVHQETSDAESRKQYQQEIGDLLETGFLADATVVVDNREIPVHKAILAARSPVFKAMFSHSMVESTQNRVTIPDICYEAFKRMLIYIYTGTAPDIELFAKELCSTADKYDVVLLKRTAENLMKKSVCSDNAVDMLLWADAHNAHDLKKFTLDFICTTPLPAVFHSQKSKMIENHPQLLREIFDNINNLI